jgi:Protein of unknown function (DUF1573)
MTHHHKAILVAAQLLTCSAALSAQSETLPGGYTPKVVQGSVSATDRTANAGKVVWVQRMQKFGTLQQDSAATRVFEVRNISRDTLVLTKVRTTCHCTTFKYTETPIPPGTSGYIETTYDAHDLGDFYKIIAVETNFDPGNAVMLSITGTVTK